MAEIDRNRIVAAAGFLAFAGISLALFARAGINSAYLDSIVLQLINMTLLSNAPIDITFLIGGLLLFALSLAFVGAYALFRDSIDWSLAGISAAMFAPILAFSGLGATNVALGFGIFLSPIIVQYVAIDDKKAYKELRPGRMISNAVGTAILAIGILSARSVFYVTSSDTSYSENALDSVVDATLLMTFDSASAEIKAIPNGEVMFKEKMVQVKEEMKAMPVFGMIRDFFPHASAITVFATIQLFSMALIAPLAGIFGWILWKFVEKEEVVAKA